MTPSQVWTNFKKCLRMVFCKHQRLCQHGLHGQLFKRALHGKRMGPAEKLTFRASC